MKYVGLLLSASLVVGACQPGPPNGGTPDASFDATDPSTGRWFGTIIVDTVVSRGGTTNPAPGTTTTQTHIEKAHTRVDISQDGHRHAATTYSLYDNKRDDIVQGCLEIKSHNLIDDAASTTSDVGGYFALSASGDGGYQAGELPGMFLIQSFTFSSHNRMEQLGCAGTTTQSNVNTVTVPEQGVLPYDHIKGSLSTDKKSAVGSATYDLGGAHYVIRWSLKRDKDIVAVVSDMQVERLADAMGDGSKSRGQIDEYTFTLTPDDDCSQMGVPVVIQKFSVGKEITQTTPSSSVGPFAAICGVKVHLHVKGPAGEDDDDGNITVTPRQWKVETDPPQKSYVSSSDLGNTATAGSNRCQREGGQYSGHYIHTDDPNNSTYENSAYVVGQIDPQEQSPFAGVYYIDTPHVYVGRLELVNVDYAMSTGFAYIATDAKNTDKGIAPLLDQQISAHENAHSTLAMDYLAAYAGTSEDPARKIEGLATMTSADAVKYANISIHDDNNTLCTESNHGAVDAILATINTSTSWGSAAEICNPACQPVNPFYAAHFDDPWCTP